MNENEAIVAAAAQVSHALLQHLKPIISKHEQNILAKMKNFYRAGDIDHLKLVSCVAELCAIEDIETTLNGRVTRAGKINMSFEGDK